MSTGIGLNLALQIAVSHGGQIKVRDNTPRGSVFTLMLPSAAPRLASQNTPWISP